MQNEIVEGAPDAHVAIDWVWMPMLPTDTERAAKKAARMFDDARVRQFYDADMRLGLAYMREAFPNCIRDAIQALPEDDPFRERLKEALALPGNPEFALWDAVLGYPAGVLWKETIPAPAFWSKQFDYWDSATDGRPTGRFWRNDCKAPPSDSDWAAEVREILKAVSP